MAPFSLSKQPRRSLPEGYQFGDAGREWYERTRPLKHAPGSFTPGTVCQLLPQTSDRQHMAWNVIEGEHFASDAERHPVVEGERVE